jgi:hypothetical protein
MIASFMVNSPSFKDAVEAASKELVRAHQVGETFYINLPMIYPDGSFVTVKVDRVEGGVLVSDAGFAYREAEDVGANRSFRRTAKRYAEDMDVSVGDRLIYVRVPIDQIERAICDVGSVSWQTATTINNRSLDEDDVQLSEELTSRLKTVFGADKVREDEKPIGYSTTEWPVSAVVTVDGHKTIFQAVGDHPNSIYRASTAFRDIAAAKKTVTLVSFVRSKAALGPKLSLLAPSRVVEESQSDEQIRKAAAA